MGGVGGAVGRWRKGGLLTPVTPMPILRSDLGPWIPGPGPPVPFLTLGTDFSLGQ